MRPGRSSKQAHIYIYIYRPKGRGYLVRQRKRWKAEAGIGHDPGA